MPDFDLVVIGSGPGGYPAAIRAAQNGLRVALIEEGDLGGVCLNCGCIPTKALAESAARFHALRDAASFGIRLEGFSVDYPAVVGRKDALVGKLRAGVGFLLQRNGVEVIRGCASFESANCLRVSMRGGGSGTVSARHVLVATGSTPAVPSFLPSAPNVLDSKSFLGLETLPSKLIVLGGGVTGCELACVAGRLGVRVTLVELCDDILPGVDPDARRLVRRSMEKLDIELLTGAPMEEIRSDGKTVSGRVAGRGITGETLLYALGRVPRTTGLNLPAAGVRTDATGAILASPCGETDAPGVFAAGDVVSGSRLLAHAATAQGFAAVARICGTSVAPSETPPPSVIFTMPEIGQTGFSEAEAEAAGYTVRTGVFPFAASGKALVEGEPEGFVKWIGDAETGGILGAVATGAHASELIAEAALAVEAGLTAGDVAGTVHAHPTLSETWREAADAFAGRCVNLPPQRPL